jgi:hypothetical protein
MRKVLGRPRSAGFPVGTQFAFLTIIGADQRKRADGFMQDIYQCRCVCGNELVKSKASLRKSPDTRCRQCAGEQAAVTRGVDGRTGTPTHNSWCAMHTRCYQTSHVAYPRYGGRGITVCRRWHDYDNFLADMGERPEGTTLERRKNNTGYSPSNCYWATRTEQQRNRRSNRYLTADGRTQLLADWAKELGTKPTTIWLRLERLGWSEQDACTVPVAPRRRQ